MKPYRTLAYAYYQETYPTAELTAAQDRDELMYILEKRIVQCIVLGEYLNELIANKGPIAIDTVKLNEMVQKRQEDWCTRTFTYPDPATLPPGEHPGDLLAMESRFNENLGKLRVAVASETPETFTI